MKFLKYYFPFLFVMIGLAAILHFVWLPYYVDTEIESILTHEKEKTRLLSDTVIPAMLSGDLAEIHTTLDNVVEKNPAWSAVVLQKLDGTQLYPLSKIELSQSDASNIVKHSLIYQEQELGNIQVQTDLESLIAPKVEKLQHLELLVLVSSFLIVMVGVFLQNRFIHLPLKKLSIATSRIAEGDFLTPLPQSSNTVLSKFVENFNHMRNDLESRDVQLMRQQTIQDAVHNMQSKFLTVQDTGAVYCDMLDTLLELSQSEFGLIGEVKYDVDNQLCMKVLVVTNIAWDLPSRNMFEAVIKGDLTFTDIDNLFCRALITGKVEINNNPESELLKMDLPAGHPAIRNYVGIPQYNGKQQLTGMVALANSKKAYTDTCISELNIIWNAIGNLIDAFHRKELLSESEAHLRAIVDNAVDGIIVIDSNGTVLTFNPAAEDIFGYNENEVINESIKILMPPMYAEHYGENLSSYLSTVKSQLIGSSREMVGQRKNGEEFFMEVSVAEVRTGTIRHFTGIVRDITERKEQESQLIAVQQILSENNEQLLGLSIKDGLTGIANRRCFDDTLDAEIKRAIRHQSSISLILFDIDHFKLYNDHYGHVEGDECLTKLANLVSEIFNRDGDLVARYGGEEFAVILPLTNESIAIKFAEVIREKIVEAAIPHEKSPTASYVSVSLGVATLDVGEFSTGSELVDLADKALYRAKSEGRNQVYSKEMSLMTAKLH
ncbi:diguanylate cyclase [Cocleimonas sp. KMM 6892]|uniref:diguanylate cyclase n=1 Tax=unclassified Cocleimonas TaxID=2639732 RepID=UPI002DB9A0F4|nr:MULTISPECIES: diguanylate cyclase [unclassified Cocleimonas]MEB8430790.1 diguanylate cyclase [Cocleimonas sp. KMM 6892]MEC4714438.1 diguanylate cyclase [Cocleimonas sp. KMM 6895]MEC4743771.1 diguanylate cyclase [Cocleimonas sp. KMM 6896]